MTTKDDEFILYIFTGTFLIVEKKRFSLKKPLNYSRGFAEYRLQSLHSMF